MAKFFIPLTSRCLLAAFSTIFVVSITAPAQAQQKPDNDWNVTIGAAGFYAPKFLGSKDYGLVPIPDVKVEYKDRFFASVFEGIGYNVINSNGWRAGPIAKYALGRDQDDDNALRGLGDVDGTFELGGFVEYTYDPFSAKLEIRQGLNGHEGMVGEASLNYSNSVDALGRPLMFSIGPRLNFASADYNNAFFGIDGTQSARSGLARYAADGGIVSYGVGGFVMMPITDSISVSAFGGYDRLSGEATDSPLIKERGSENQFMIGLAVSYQFGW